MSYSSNELEKWYKFERSLSNPVSKNLPQDLHNRNEFIINRSWQSDMNVLILCDGKIFPPIGGGPEHIYELVKGMSVNNTVDVVTWGDKWGTSESYSIVKGNLRIFHYGVVQSPMWTMKNNLPLTLREAIWSLGGANFFDLLFNKSPPLHKVTNDLRQSYDLVINLAPNTNKIKKFYKSGYNKTIELFISVGLPNYISNLDEWLKFIGHNSLLNVLTNTKINTLIDFIVTWFEARTVSAKTVICVSGRDVEKLRPFVRANVKHTLPPTTESKLIKKPESIISDMQRRKKVLFFSVKGIVSDIAIKYILTIAKDITWADFFITGYAQKPLKTKEIKSNINSMGYIPDKEFEELIVDSDVIVFPLVSGSGVQTKIIKAMSFGKAIITTSIVSQPFEGLVSGREMVIEDSPKRFKERLVELLLDDDLRSKISKGSLDYYRRNLSQEVLIKKNLIVYGIETA